MNNDDIFQIILPCSLLLMLLFGYFLLSNQKQQKKEQRMARVTRKAISNLSQNHTRLSLKKTTHDKSLPLVSALLAKLPRQAVLKARLERAGLTLSVEKYISLLCVVMAFSTLLFVILHKSLFISGVLGAVITLTIPHFVINIITNKRMKKFILLFPEAIDFIVRGLRSGLPVTESMNAVGKEMQEPVGTVFGHMGESIRLGMPVDKALQDMAAKLGLTEFNFFVTSIILQRETGGNLSEILSNLSEVLRSRTMMRLKIKAMSSEAKASAIIVGSLPFIVIGALQFISPDYLDPLMDSTKGNLIAGGCILSLLTGITIMIKMTKFEI